MNLIKSLFQRASRQARKKRAGLFTQSFHLDENTKILDLGSEDGSNIHALLAGTRVQSSNVYIADIDSVAVANGEQEYGFIPIVISESGVLPFEDGFFDIVYASSVIEHVTVSKKEVWTLHSGRLFRNASIARQTEFSSEIKRLGRQYFVQTPNKGFPIESHSWLPFVGWLPRRLLIPTLRFTNLFWIKETSPDWHLLNKSDMQNLFADAEILKEKKFLLTKSLMAIKTEVRSAQIHDN